MKTIIKTLLSLSIISVFNPSAYAAVDAAAGEKTAEACVACHGKKGINKNAQFPNLAGQQAAYISAQLRAFKKETRINPMMQPLAKKLSKEDINNLAAYFSSLKNESAHASDIQVTKETESKANMCKGCHGSNGQGRGTFPRLANQHVKYLETQLKAFKSGDRKGGPMSNIASSLSDEEIKQLSVYFSGLKNEKK